MSPELAYKMETTTPNNQVSYVGMDIAKDRLDYTVDGVRALHVANTTKGHRTLIEQLHAVPQVRVVCEATGGYERAAVAALQLAGISVCVVNPGRVRAFARADGLLAKTDKLDAQLLRRFGERMDPREHVCSDQAAITLRELLDYRREISDQLVAVGNKSELAGTTLRQRLEGLRAFLKEELKQTDSLIETHINTDEQLSAKASRLRELQGVGPVLCSTLMAYVPELGRIESPQLAALIGVAPFAHDSGRRHRCRRVRGGRGTVRSILYMAAVAAIRHNPVMRAFYHRLVDAGKLKKIAIVAVMRKMLHVLNHMVKNPNFVLVR